MAETPQRPSLAAIFWEFLRIGATAFGGFMALVAVIRDRLVRQKGWLADEEVLDGVSLGGILPGPLAVNVTAFVGYRIRGISGALVAMAAVLLPAFLLVLGLSWVYFTWGDLPAMESVFAGIMPAIIAIIFSVAWKLAKTHLKSIPHYLIMLAALPLLILVGGFYMTAAIIMVSGILGRIFFQEGEKMEVNSPENQLSLKKFLPLLGLMLLMVLPALFLDPGSHRGLRQLVDLFFTFSGISLTLFGGGYVIIPALQQIVVSELSWLSAREFADGIALGQVTPGPILISAAFIGFKQAGILGALTATLGMFVPPALLMILASGMLQSLKKHPGVQAAFRGIRPAVIGMIFAAVWIMGKDLEPGLTTFIVLPLALGLSLFTRLNVIWIIPGAGLLGFLIPYIATL
ncbi:MAG: chromate efflux transporter [Bacteroidia bacterium]|nr:chromate efflux transporter [Bacteroidia bacterium]